MRIQALIVDDEALARGMIREFLKERHEIEIAGECENGVEALAAIRQLHPELVFLDIQMPELDGFGVLSQLDPSERPEVIFVTAYDKYAIAAFEVNALDYLLKPFPPARFQQALDRALDDLSRRRSGEIGRKLERLLAHLDGREQPLATTSGRIIVRDAGRITFLKIDEIDWVEAARDYACIHVGEKIYILHETMARLEAMLDSRYFCRIHRSTIVNLDRVTGIETNDLGESSVVMRDQRLLRVSRACREKLLERMGVAQTK